MSHENIPALPSPLESVKYQFEEWRKTRKNRRERIPETLWSAAVGLRNQYSVNQISRALGLNYNDLKKRIPEQNVYSKRKKLSSSDFVELDWQSGFSGSECIIEMEDTYCSRMRMSFKGSTDLDLLELGKAFWSKGK
jgi:hypothetical protein